MNSLTRFGLAATLATLGITHSQAELEVSASVTVHSRVDFEAPLAAHGSWVVVGSYGRCWRPAGVAVEWRPYCYGEWVWTDCGWYWASDEPWGWACYHYGYWVDDPVYAWVWVPGIEWAPAWVSWRAGAAYIGWAPLPPPGFALSVAAAPFVFVETRRFTDPIRPRTVIVNNTTILNQTTVINNVTRETRNIGGATPQRVVVNKGPGPAVVEKATGKTLQAVPIRQEARQAAPPRDFSPRTSESKSHDRANISQPDHFRPTPDVRSAPNQNQQRFGKPAPYRSYPEPWTPGVDRRPEQSPVPAPPHGKPDHVPEAQGGGGDHQHHGEGHGKDKP